MVVRNPRWTSLGPKISIIHIQKRVHTCLNHPKAAHGLLPMSAYLQPTTLRNAFRGHPLILCSLTLLQVTASHLSSMKVPTDSLWITVQRCTSSENHLSWWLATSESESLILSDTDRVLPLSGESTRALVSKAADGWLTGWTHVVRSKSFIKPLATQRDRATAAVLA